MTVTKVTKVTVTLGTVIVNGACMREGILNEPVRESAEKLLSTFSDQMGTPFSNLIFIAVAPDGTFRSANFGGEFALTKEAFKLVAKHLENWAETLEE